MTYAEVLSTTRVSDLGLVLNGLTVRSTPMILSTSTGGTWAPEGSTVGAPSFELDVGEKVWCQCPIPERVDVLEAPTCRLMVAPTTSEATVGVRLRFTGSFVHDTSTSSVGDSSTNLDSADTPVPGTANQLTIVDIPLDVALWDSATSGFVFADIVRVGVLAGSELVGDLALLGASLVYTIER